MGSADYPVDEAALGRQPLNERKLQELILYIARSSLDDECFGATKLNKLLFLADFTAYLETGSAITWDEYQRLDQGPAPRHAVPARDRLVESGAIVVREVDYFGHRQDRVIPLRKPDLDLFSGEEIAIVDRLIRDWWGWTAAAMSRASHEFVGWQVARPSEGIPYETALLAPVAVTAGEIGWARQFERQAREWLSETVG